MMTTVLSNANHLSGILPPSGDRVIKIKLSEKPTTSKILGGKSQMELELKTIEAFCKLY